ncbi:helix-turn-helix domain-containing protein [Heliophilum fasciatum]|uniref:Transcriptional regulator with XRE-family HTH domain n=1 Tax=Heliophilum fasciatum TaxID=35700 RepID=A0A4R2RI61_9FIRM|nr:helix-turn-helix transcriptional regulator [Heliophilum fasciatum]MCW2278757.1 transcriptional regulator with XRE-family HTH domain [Heliophilum fasciatum]TCP62504.1 transcriptional regulator with XRE-family HTH domain [Heliophilum fasciatum]
MAARRADPISPEERVEILKKQVEAGAYLAHLRKQKGLTYSQLGEQLGVSASYLSRLEKGGEYPSDHLVRKIANHFEIMESDLFEKLGRSPLIAREVLERHPHLAKAYEQVEKDPDFDDIEKNQFYDEIAQMYQVVYERRKSSIKSVSSSSKGAVLILGTSSFFSYLIEGRDAVDAFFIARMGWHNYVVLEDLLTLFLGGIVFAPLITYVNYRLLKGVHKWVTKVSKKVQIVNVISEDGAEHHFSDPENFSDYIDLLYLAIFPQKRQLLSRQNGETLYYIKKDLQRSRAIWKWLITIVLIFSIIASVLVIGVTPDPTQK